MDSSLICNNRTGKTFRLFDAIQKEKLNYVYRGYFTSNFTSNILSLAQSNINDEETASEIKKRVYHVMVEGLQNISRHQAGGIEDVGSTYGLFAVKKMQDRYILTTGNLIENERIGSLTNKIKKVNGLDKIQLKNYHKEELQNGKISEKRGAGLGLIDIARRSGSKLEYAFNPISNKLSYFYLQTEITSNSLNEKYPVRNNNNSLISYTNLHPLLNDDNVLIVFNNSFNQESLLDMLSFLEKQMGDSNRLKRQIFNVMIELFQNITKHASDYMISKDGKQGIFYISENEKEFYLNTGNYMENDKVRVLRGRLNYINNLDDNDLENFYDKRLFDFEMDSNKGAGLGLIDLRIKSGNKLTTDFQKINNEYSFFTLKVKILKS
jgi:hypothetical protein